MTRFIVRRALVLTALLVGLGVGEAPPYWWESTENQPPIWWESTQPQAPHWWESTQPQAPHWWE